MTPSTQSTCDLMLPLTTVAERDGIVFTHYSSLPVTYGVMTPAIKRVGETKSDMELGFELGNRLQPDFWSQYDSFTDFVEKFRLLGKMSLEEAREKVCIQRGHVYRKYEKGLLRGDGGLGFNTPSGRVELWSTMFQRFGDDPLPYYEEPQYSPISTPELLEDFPFVLTTGARRYEYFHSEGKQIPYLRELHPEPTFDINPVDADALGIVDNDMCVLKNQFGVCELRANVSPIVKPGVVQADHGWWYLDVILSVHLPNAIDKGLRILGVDKLPLCIWVGKNHPLAKRQSIGMKELDGLTVRFLDPQKSRRYVACISKILSDHDVKIVVGKAVNRSYSAGGNDVLGVLPEFQHPLNYNLRTVRINDSDPITLCAASLAKNNSKVIDAFFDSLSAVLSKQ